MQNASFGTLVNCWWSSLCASFTNFKCSKLEQAGTPLMGAMLTPMSGHTLFSSFKTKSSQHVLLRISLGSAGHIPVDAQWVDRDALTQGVSQHSDESGGMPQLCACPPSPFPVPFQLSPSLLYIPSQTVSLCLVLMSFFLFARLISLFSHFFPWFCISWIFIDSALYSFLHAGQVNWLHGSSASLWYRNYLYMLLLISVHIFNFSRANTYTISYSASTSYAAFLHFTSVANSLFWHTSVLISLLVFLNHEQSCMSKRPFSRTWQLFQVQCVSRLPSTLSHLPAPG